MYTRMPYRLLSKADKKRLYFISSSVTVAITSEDDYERALEGAARSGFLKVVEQLQISRFVSYSKTQSKPDKLRKKIRKSIQGGELNVLRQFLSARIKDKDIRPPNAVSLAVLYDHRELVEFLLDQGLSVGSKGAFGTPLRTAALLNSETLARLLLDRGADVNNACGKLGIALQAVALQGRTAVLKLLIDEGADVNQQTGFYGTALQAAAYHGHPACVRTLLDVGASAYAKGYYTDAFHTAADGGHQDIIVMMLQKGYKLRDTPRRGLHGPRGMVGDNIHPYKRLLRDASSLNTYDLKFREEHQRHNKIRGEIAIERLRNPAQDLDTMFSVADDNYTDLFTGPNDGSSVERKSRLDAFGDGWGAA